MWKNVLTGIILENIETLKYYQTVKDNDSNLVENINQYIADVIMNFPWYFGLPVRILASAIGLLCLVSTGHPLNLLSSEKRSSFIRRIQFIPLYDMLNKLVRSMAFLKLFDGFSQAPDALNSANCKSN